MKGWGPNVSRDMKLYIRPNETVPLLNPKGVCNETFNLLIVVCTAVENFVQRQLIRQIWGAEARLQNFTTKVVFLIGFAETEAVKVRIHLQKLHSYG